MDGLQLKEKLKFLPEASGVYLMKNAKGEIIYVGKARILKNRVRSYFVGVDSKDLKTKVLLKNIVDFEIIITKNEGEALLLERSLIRHHHPHYNVIFKDGKEYPYIRVDFNEPWPRIEKVRRRKNDGAFYLGPFSNAGYLATAQKLMGRIFPLIRCSRHEFKNVQRPCNYYHMKMCLGPCKLPVERDLYIGLVKNSLAFLMGKNKDLLQELKEKMQVASAEEKYEIAAQFRDQMTALQEIAKRQSAVVKTVQDADVIGMYAIGEQVCFHVVMVREGRIIGGENFIATSPMQNNGEAMHAFIMQYYDNRLLPQELILEQVVEDLDVLLKTLSCQELMTAVGHETKVTYPQKGPRAELMAMANTNAKYHLEETLRQGAGKLAELAIVQKFLRLKDLPTRMECIDVSNMQGANVVASLVCFVDGRPAKEHYRHYIIRDIAVGEQNDFASIEEVVRRRIERGEREGDLPDLLIIDGGKGQLGAGLKAIEQFPQINLPIISLAKSRALKSSLRGSNEIHRSYERVFFPNEELALPLKPGTVEYRMLTHIRDEAHRFAINHHRKKMRKSMQASELDEIPGVGPMLRKKILAHFSGIEGVRNASFEQLRQVKGVSEKIATLIHAYMNASEFQ